MRRLSPAARWWVLPAFTAGVCAAAAALNFIVGNWVGGIVVGALAFITVIGRRTQVHAYRAGYWRGSYEQMAGDLDLDRGRVLEGWQPSPWDEMPPPPWEDPASPTKH
jgi:hypothetical protein